MSAVTETSRGPLVNVATWITVSTMVIAVISKIAVRWSVMRKFQPDDFLLTLAAILAIGQSIATSSEVQSGLGRHESTLTPDDLEAMLKSQYASGFLYLSVIFVTKLAGFAFFVSLMGPMIGRAVAIIRMLAAFCMLWMLAGFFAIAFQCRLPTPWEYGTGLCINKPAFWTATAVVDIATQIMVSFIPTFLLKDLQTSTARRMLAMFSFTPNLLTIPLAVLRLLFIYNQDKLVDRSWDWYNVVLMTTIHAQMAVVLGAIPFLKPLIDSMVILPAVIPNDGDLTAVDDSTAGSSLKPQNARWIRSLSAFTTHSSTAAGVEAGTSSSKQHVIQRNETTVEAAGPSSSAHDRSSLPADAELGASLDGHRMAILHTREFAVTS